MAGKSRSIKCPSCGAANDEKARRCASCGASMKDKPGAPSEAQVYGKQGFSFLWVLIALGVQAVLTGAIIVALPQAVAALDFEGSYGMLLSIPVWFLGGMLVGLISPGRTFAEPVVASLVVAIPTAMFLYGGQTVRTLPWFMYAILSVLGVMFSLVGAYVGERIQMGPAPPSPAT